jgi:hypothetical protein
MTLGQAGDSYRCHSQQILKRDNEKNMNKRKRRRDEGEGRR